MLKIIVVFLLLTCLGVPQDLNSYKITEKSLREMGTSGVPNPILKKLERLKDQSVLGKDKFLERLKAALGEIDTEAYQSIILKYTDDPLHESVEYAEPTRFEASAEKTSYYVGEPVGLKLTAYNDRDKPIQGSFQLMLGYDVAVYYRRGGGEFIEYSPWRVENQPSLITAPIVIPAYGKREDIVGLFYNSPTNKLVLAEPGEYEFKAKYTSLESNIVRVTVMHPPEEERAALAALSDPELLQFVEGDINMNANPTQAGVVAEKAAAFLEKYPQSIYSPTVERMLKFNLEEAARVPTRMTPKLKALSQWLRERQ